MHRVVFLKGNTNSHAFVGVLIYTKSEISVNYASRDDGIEVTLLPIPNRTVKVYSADGTARVTVWQSRTLRGNLKEIVIITISFYI